MNIHVPPLFTLSSCKTVKASESSFIKYEFMFVIFRSFRNVSSTSFRVSRSTELLFRRFFSMKLYTDKYNPFTLRVLVADRLAGTAVGVQHVQRDGMLMKSCCCYVV
jgi:hypothetical protein